MNKIEPCIARKEYLPMPEEAQRKFEKFEKAFDKEEVEENSLIQNFATGMICGSISAVVTSFIYVSQAQLSPKLTDRKVRTIACLFFAMTCAIVSRCLVLERLCQLNPVTIINSLIKK